MRLLAQMVGGLLRFNTPKKEVTEFMKNNNVTKQQLLDYCNSDDFRTQRSESVGSDFARKLIENDKKLIETL